MADRRIHLIDAENGLSWVIADTTELCREAIARHQCGRVAGISLAKTLTGALLMGSTLKDGEKQSLQINTDGKLRFVMAEAWADGRVRGYPSAAQIKEIDESFAHHSTCLGTEAQVGVVRSLDGDVRYSGSIALKGPTIPKAVSEYLNNSEQLYSAVELYAQYKDGSILNATGVILRLLPGGNEELFQEFSERFAKSQVFEILTNQEPIEVALSKIMPTLDFTKATESEVRFGCECSRERVVSMLISLGKEELEDMRAKDGEADINCHFCGTVYHFEGEDLDRFIADFDRPQIVPLTPEEEAELDAIEAKVKAQQAEQKAEEDSKGESDEQS